MDIKWVSHLKNVSQKQKEEYVQAIKASTLYSSRLEEILLQKKDTIERTELSAETYDNPNWANKQAYFNGQKSMLQYVIDLVRSVKEKE